MRKKLLTGLLIMGMMMQSLTIPALAAPSVAYSETEENTDDSLLLAEETIEESPANEETASPEPTQMPEAMPEAAPEATAEAAPEATPEATAEATAEATPEATAEAIPEATPEATAEAIPEATPDGEEEEKLLPSQEGEEEKCEQLSGKYVYQEGAVNAVTKNRKTGQNDITLDSTADAVDWTAVYEYVYQQLKAKKTEIPLSQYKITCGDDAKCLVSNVVNEHPDLYFVNVGESLIWYNSSNIVTKIEPDYYSGCDDTAFVTAVGDALSTVSDMRLPTNICWSRLG